MKTFIAATLAGGLALGSASAEVKKSAKAPAVAVKTEVAVTTETAVATETPVYNQKPLPGYPVLISKEQADAVVAKFKAAYPGLGSPRILIYVNRELVDDQSGMRLTARNEKVQTTKKRVDSTVEGVPSNVSGNVTINAGRDANVSGRSDWDYPGKGTVKSRTDHINTENRYSNTERRQTLADRQTTRDVERLFGRPLRAAGATLADQRVATQLIANRPIKDMMLNTEGEQARKDREALAKIADVVVEVLVSSRNVVVPEVFGDKVYAAPDIHATAIRLSDSKVLGQAASRDVVGKDRYAGRIVRNFDVQEIAEATALALMEDMALAAQ